MFWFTYHDVLQKILILTKQLKNLLFFKIQLPVDLLHMWHEAHQPQMLFLHGLDIQLGFPAAPENCESVIPWIIGCKPLSNVTFLWWQ